LAKTASPIADASCHVRWAGRHCAAPLVDECMKSSGGTLQRAGMCLLLSTLAHPVRYRPNLIAFLLQCISVSTFVYNTLNFSTCHL